MSTERPHSNGVRTTVRTGIATFIGSQLLPPAIGNGNVFDDSSEEDLSFWAISADHSLRLSDDGNGGGEGDGEGKLGEV